MCDSDVRTVHQTLSNTQSEWVYIKAKVVVKLGTE